MVTVTREQITNVNHPISQPAAANEPRLRRASYEPAAEKPLIYQDMYYTVLGRRAQGQAAAELFHQLGRYLRWSWRWLVSSYRRHRAASLAMRELEAMNDHLLRDIGIERDQIADVVLNQRRRNVVSRSDATPAGADNVVSLRPASAEAHTDRAA